jgi:hypothetical protein
MYKITAHFGREMKVWTSLNKTVTSWCTIFHVYITPKYFILLYKILYAVNFPSF